MHLKIFFPQVLLLQERTGAPQKLLRLRQQRCRTPYCYFTISCTSCNRPRAPGWTGGTPATSCPTNSVDLSAAHGTQHRRASVDHHFHNGGGGVGGVCSSPAAVFDADTRRPARRELPTATRLAIGRRRHSCTSSLETPCLQFVQVVATRWRRPAGQQARRSLSAGTGSETCGPRLREN